MTLEVFSRSLGGDFHPAGIAPFQDSRPFFAVDRYDKEIRRKSRQPISGGVERGKSLAIEFSGIFEAPHFLKSLQEINKLLYINALLGK